MNDPMTTRMAFLSLPIRLAAAAFLAAVLPVGAAHGQARTFDIDLCLQAPTYVAHRVPAPPAVDGRLDDPAWASAPWTTPFVEMAGGGTPERPGRAKLVWDGEALYVAARLEEPDVWATLAQRDTNIYLDNAFEVFIDPTSDTHAYYELEVNALGTLWDLLLLRPYRDGGPALSAWDVRGIEVGVDVEGTLNDPSDRDAGWSVELRLPWDVIEEAAPAGRRPADGDQWRVNFSRSHWTLDVVDGSYQKVPDTPARWSVWSPQGIVDIHRPDCWGIVQFAQGGETAFVEHLDDRIKNALRRLYYHQRDYRDAHGSYARDLADLDAGEIAVDGVPFDPELRVTQSGYEIESPGAGGSIVHIREDGRVWVEQP